MVTIGIPHYKAIESLRRLLDGLNKQKIRTINLLNDTEIIVVNDDSEIILNASDFNFEKLNIMVINQKNKGVAAARNKALELAKGDLIFFLDVDCIPMSNWLQSMIDCFSVDQDIDGFGGRVEPLRSHGLVNEYFNIINHLKTPIIDKTTNKVTAIVTANCGFRLSALKKAGGFNQQVFHKCPPGGEDIDLSYRLRNLGYVLSYNPSAVVLHEYPQNFWAISKKFSNYGRGIRLVCISQKIDPKTIKQPRLNLISFIIYNLQVFNKMRRCFSKFKYYEVGFLRATVFLFFDMVKHFSYGYGFFLKDRY